jgi:hypothetical protein
MSRTGERVFGVAAIAAGLGIVVAAATGLNLPSILLALIPLVVIGWLIYHWTVVRRRATRID